MEQITNLLAITLGAILANNFIFSQFPAGMMTLPVGGFLVLGVLIAAMQWALSRPKKNKEESK